MNRFWLTRVKTLAGYIIDSPNRVSLDFTIARPQFFGLMVCFILVFGFAGGDPAKSESETENRYAAELESNDQKCKNLREDREKIEKQLETACKPFSNSFSNCRKVDSDQPQCGCVKAVKECQEAYEAAGGDANLYLNPGDDIDFSSVEGKCPKDIFGTGDLSTIEKRRDRLKERRSDLLEKYNEKEERGIEAREQMYRDSENFELQIKKIDQEFESAPEEMQTRLADIRTRAQAEQAEKIDKLQSDISNAQARMDDISRREDEQRGKSVAIMQNFRRLQEGVITSCKTKGMEKFQEYYQKNILPKIIKKVYSVKSINDINKPQIYAKLQQRLVDDCRRVEDRKLLIERDGVRLAYWDVQQQLKSLSLAKQETERLLESFQERTLYMVQLDGQSLQNAENAQNNRLKKTLVSLYSERSSLSAKLIQMQEAAQRKELSLAKQQSQTQQELFDTLGELSAVENQFEDLGGIDAPRSSRRSSSSKDNDQPIRVADIFDLAANLETASDKVEDMSGPCQKTVVPPIAIDRSKQ